MQSTLNLCVHARKENVLRTELLKIDFKIFTWFPFTNFLKCKWPVVAAFFNFLRIMRTGTCPLSESELPRTTAFKNSTDYKPPLSPTLRWIIVLIQSYHLSWIISLVYRSNLLLGNQSEAERHFSLRSLWGGYQCLQLIFTYSLYFLV